MALVFELLFMTVGTHFGELCAIFNRLNLRLSEKSGLGKHSYLNYALVGRQKGKNFQIDLPNVFLSC